jgi:ABC-2 type transport system ATP-binding protein
MSDAILTENLTKRFWRGTTALAGLNLRVPEGTVCALVGPNGAGKSTALKLLLNLIQPSGGEAKVLGRDCTKLGPRDFREIGYVSEDQRLPLWMTPRQYLDFLRPFYPTWDEAFREKMTGLLDLDLTRRLKQCSRGMRMKAALLAATAFRPRLLILDEPFSGLDPLVREQFLQGLLELTQEEGWTILLSSHDMEELERIADTVAFLDTSHLLLHEPVDALLERFRRVEVPLPPDQAATRNPPATWLEFREGNGFAHFIDTAWSPETFAQGLRAMGGDPARAQCVRLSLREIFVVLAKQSQRNRGA